jgi:MoxR-like ATPases
MANNAKIDLHNKVSPTGLEGIIKTVFKSFHDPKTMNKEATRSKIKSMPIMVWGSPGIAKSSVVRKCAEDLGIGFIDVRLCQIEPCDIRGLPVPDKENKVMNWFVNGVWPRDKESKGILFLDELSACDKSIAVAAYELILDRRLGTLYSLPEGWLVVAAGNKATDRAVSSTMSSALANRFMHFELDCNAEDWFKWGVRNGIHPAVLGFVKYRPDSLFSMDKQNLERGWPSPRSWENVSKMCYVFAKNEAVLRKAVYGLVGNAAGGEFMEFFKLSESFEDVLKYMLDPSLDIEKAYGSLAKLDMSRKYALTTALIYHVWRGGSAEETRRRVDGFFRVLERLTPEFASMGCLGAAAGGCGVTKARACEILSGSAGFRSFIKTHRDNIHREIDVDVDTDGKE